jgi:hypothetical protein
LARNPLQIGDYTNPLSSAPYAIPDPTDPMAYAGAQNTVSAVDKLGQWLADKHAEGVKAGNWVGGYPWQGGHPTWQAAKGAVDEYAQGMLLGTTSSGGGLRAYHGSPHKFDQFSDHAIGTGEGAQAYGYGHYLAENEGVARGYRDALSRKQSGVMVDGTPAEQVNLSPSAVQIAQMHLDGTASMDALRASNEATLAKARAGLEKYPNSQINQMNAEAAQRTLAALDELKGKQLAFQPNPGHMYEVNVAADPEKFLHWDKPLSEQSQHVRDRISGRTDWATPDMTGARLLGEIQKRANNDPVAASQQLNDMGIPGIRYLDAGSRGAGEGTYNSVVFDPANLEIIRRYGLAGLMGGGAAAATQQQPNALVAP